MFSVFFLRALKKIGETGDEANIIIMLSAYKQ